MSLTSSSSKSAQSERPRKIWWLVAVVVLALCVFVQLPAIWLFNKFAPDNNSIQQISGNIWHGSAIVQMPESFTTTATSPIPASITWQWRPLALFLGKLGADIDIESGQSQLHGQVNRSLSQWQLRDWSGKIDKQTLASFVNWQLPDAPIQVNAVSLNQVDDIGFEEVSGQLTWVGGDLGYPSGAKTYQILLPAMRADLSNEQKDGQQVLHANLVSQDGKRFGDIYIDNDAMLDVSLTQRFLENMPEYEGSAPADTAVVNVRQPLLGGS
ncbi:type II secretion system protein N [Psychrobacter sp. I-STPA10]|uniref:type II secretion system protein N n=1 Tax=Psychrobacter sp. I-STPA10 TaxID=2585769 RepID=UPI001E4EE63E|nr:type II secretion system protein N [Psychrobacter sp. I-STPA10]